MTECAALRALLLGSECSPQLEPKPIRLNLFGN